MSALTVYNGELIVGGSFVETGGVPANSIARWDGSNWHAMGSGMNGAVVALDLRPFTDQGERIGRLLIENRRLQRERDEAISLIPDELPPPTRKQVMVGATVGLVKWLGVASLLLTAAAEVASIIKPEYVGPLQSLRKLFEGLAG